MSRKVVVLGNGPSLKNVNFSEKFKGVPTIGCNHLYKNTQGFVPTFYCIMDPRFFLEIQEGFDLLNQLNTIWILNTDVIDTMPDGLYESLVSKSKVKPINFVYTSDFTSLERYDKTNFNGIISGGNVVISLSIPLAVHIGAEEIYLYGVDFNLDYINHFYDTPETFKKYQESWNELKRMKEYKIIRKVQSGKTTILYGTAELSDHYTKLPETIRTKVLRNFDHTKVLCERENVKVYNANSNSYVKTFEFRELNE